MKTGNSSQLTCNMMPYFNPEDWESIARAFQGAQPCLLQQAWLPTPEAAFRPCRVRTGCSNAALFVYAELEDEDIYNPITEFNAPSYCFGDVFEIFLRPAGQSAYYELHVTPQNQKFQLRIPSAEAFQRIRESKKGIPDEWLISDWELDARVDVRASQSKWRVFARIPFDRIAEIRRPQAGDQWLFSFSRYDYTRGKEKPVLSSSSPHQAIDYHRQHEWRTLTFAHMACEQYEGISTETGMDAHSFELRS